MLKEDVEVEHCTKMGYRSNKIVTENYFCVRHKSRRKHNQHFELLYLIINIHFGASNQLSACSKINLLFINTIYLVLSSLEIKRTLIQTKVFYKLLLLCLKINNSQNFRSIATVKNLFSSENVINGRQFFFVKIIFLPSGFFNCHFLLFESDLEEVRILFFLF